MAKQKFIFKLYNNKTEKFKTSWSWNTTGKSWKRLSDLESELARMLNPRFATYRSQNYGKEDNPPPEDLEIIKYEIVEEKRETVSAIDSIKRLAREKYIQSTFGWVATGLLKKLQKSDLLQFRYLIIFKFEGGWYDNELASKEIKKALKDMGIKRGTDYRYTHTAIAFRDEEHATIARLSCPDDATTNVIDLEKLEEIVPDGQK